MNVATIIIIFIDNVRMGCKENKKGVGGVGRGRVCFGRESKRKNFHLRKLSDKEIPLSFPAMQTL